MSAYKKTDIDVAIVDWLQKNSNKENTFCIDEIIKQIYEVEDREFNELIDKKYNNNNCKQKRSEKRKDRRNQNRKTVAKHLEKLISNGIIRSIERKKCEVIEGGGEEGIDFDTENLGENWFREWQFFYNQPIGLIELKALCECALQLNNVLIDEKLKLVDSLAVCAGENLAESFKKNLQISNPSYAAALQLYEDNVIKPVNNYTFAGTRWTKGHLTYDNVDVLSNLDQIYNCFLSKGRKHPKMRFKLYNFDESGNREFIRGSGVYECFPLYIFSSEGRFWLVNIMHTTNTACGYYEHYNFSPLDLMDDIEVCEEECTMEDYRQLKERTDDFHKIVIEHQIGGQFFSYEPPMQAVIIVKYNERMKRIPYDLINRSFGEDYFVDSQNSSDKSVRIMVKRSPYSIRQWAKVHDECVEIEGFYDHKGQKL